MITGGPPLCGGSVFISIQYGLLHSQRSPSLSVCMCFGRVPTTYLAALPSFEFILWFSFFVLLNFALTVPRAASTLVTDQPRDSPAALALFRVFVDDHFFVFFLKCPMRKRFGCLYFAATRMICRAIFAKEFVRRSARRSARGLYGFIRRRFPPNPPPPPFSAAPIPAPALEASMWCAPMAVTTPP